jgi:hypothetical protein
MASSDLQVVVATEDLLRSMAGRLRERDVVECRAAADMTAEEGLFGSFDASEKCWVALWKGRATIAFGVSKMADLIGSPWMLATDDIKAMAFTFLEESPKYIDLIKEPYALLLNWVDERNDISIKWLLRMGFTIGTARPYGPFATMFHPFWMRGGTIGCCSGCSSSSPASS